MGYDAIRFVAPVDEEFICSICMGVFENPVHGRCGHAYCRSCIYNWITNHENTCPLDRIPLYPEELVDAPLPFKNLINRLLIKCDYACQGCTHVCMIASLKVHHMNCMFNPKSEMFCDQCRHQKVEVKNEKKSFLGRLFGR